MNRWLFKAWEYVSLVLERTDRNGRLIVPWLPTVRVPLAAFVWGISIRENPWAAPIGLFILIVEQR